MRLVIERNALVKALGHVASVVERRNTVAILSNVLVEATENGLHLKATDMEREITQTVPAEISQPGAITVSAHILHDIARKLPDGAETELSTINTDGRLLVSAGQARFTLQARPAEEFPDLSTGAFDVSFDLHAHDLKRLLEKTRFAMSTEEIRYYLNGIYLHTVPANGVSMLRAVATDGHRLAQVEVPAPAEAEGMVGVIIPRKTVGELYRITADLDERVTIALSANKAQFVCGPVTLTSKLVDGTFPDYTRVIPIQNDKRLEVSNAAFKGAVDRVSTISSDRGRPVKLELGPNRLVLSVNNPDSGSATEHLEVGYGASPLEIGFNAKYLIDISEQLESDTAHFLLADAGSPTLVRDDGDQTALYVLMPMRV